jgi:hypothetical protein
LADAKFVQDDGCHGFLDSFQLALIEVADWKAVSHATEEDTEVVDPGVLVALTGTGSK